MGKKRRKRDKPKTALNLLFSKEEANIMSKAFQKPEIFPTGLEESKNLINAVDIGAILAALWFIFSFIRQIIASTGGHYYGGIIKFGALASSTGVTLLAFYVTLLAGIISFFVPSYLNPSPKVDLTLKNKIFFGAFLMAVGVFMGISQILDNFIISLIFLGMTLILSVSSLWYYHKKFTFGGLALLLFFIMSTILGFAVGIMDTRLTPREKYTISVNGFDEVDRLVRYDDILIIQKGNVSRAVPFSNFIESVLVIPDTALEGSQ